MKWLIVALFVIALVAMVAAVFIDPWDGEE